jgi:polyhydroxyalkanoate synthesis regulator protein
VDQITAVENFIAFKKLMVKRNTELNEQAMQMFSKGNKAPTKQPAQTVPAQKAAQQ